MTRSLDANPAVRLQALLVQVRDTVEEPDPADLAWLRVTTSQMARSVAASHAKKGWAVPDIAVERAADQAYDGVLRALPSATAFESAASASAYLLKHVRWRILDAAKAAQREENKRRAAQQDDEQQAGATQATAVEIAHTRRLAVLLHQTIHDARLRRELETLFPRRDTRESLQVGLDELLRVAFEPGVSTETLVTEELGDTVAPTDPLWIEARERVGKRRRRARQRMIEWIDRLQRKANSDQLRWPDARTLDELQALLQGPLRERAPKRPRTAGQAP